MQTKRIHHLLTVALAAGLIGCGTGDAPDYIYGENISSVEFNLYSTDMGVHPDRSVLDDPNNPFGAGGLDPNGNTKWGLLGAAGNPAGFYAWATILAIAPTGEHQFYTAVKLEDIYRAGDAEDYELPFIRRMALRGYQAVLDYFPESLTFDPTGTVYNRVAPFAVQRIIQLGGTPEGGWVLVANEDGVPSAVQVDQTELADEEDE